MTLTELSIKQAKPSEKTYMLSDGKGLGLEVRPNGGKYWIIRYWINRKEHRISAGIYPDVSLKQARDKNYEFRKTLETGKPQASNKETFKSIAEEWMEKRIAPKCTKKYIIDLQGRLNRQILPAVGKMKLKEITSAVILRLCREIEADGTIVTASLVKQTIGAVFNYAIATDRAESNPALALRGALQTNKTKHNAAITDPAEIATLMRLIDAYPFPVLRAALKFSAMTFCRPSEIRHAEWDEIKWDKREWRIPEEKMKMKRVHVVPLATQTVELLTNLERITGDQRYLFPSARKNGKCISESSIRVALAIMGYEGDKMTPHGFRGMACTNLYENNFPEGVIERQLAHAERNKVKAAYNHAEYLPERHKMMQWWADWLDNLS